MGEELKPEDFEKKGPRVLSRINFEMKDFSISDGEIKRLPANWKKIEGLKFYVDRDRFEFLDKKKEASKKDDGSTLDEKDILNFLNQNSRTVLKQLRVNILGEKDLKNLLKFEKKAKDRKNILDFIKTLMEVGE